MSPGCSRCYAAGIAARFSGPGKPFEGLARRTPGGPTWTGKIRLVPARLDQPLRWKAPRRVFVNSMSDLFHEGIPDSFIDQVFAVMALAERHQFQVLTKRAARMRAYTTDPAVADRVYEAAFRMLGATGARGQRLYPKPTGFAFPLPNVWLGVSVEDRKRLARLDDLRQTPAAVRFVSFEPLLEDLGAVDLSGIQWAIIGGESGTEARPCNLAWIRSLRDQCRMARVPVFVKQLGGRPFLHATAAHESAGPGFRLRVANLEIDTTFRLQDRKGGDPAEWPADLRVREFPT